MILKDGSGLSRSNAISANHFCQLLTYMFKSSNFNDFKETLPVAGKTGTIASLCKGQPGEGRIFAKSGTISKVKAYAGYVYSKSGKKLAFSISILKLLAPKSHGSHGFISMAILDCPEQSQTSPTKISLIVIAR